MVREGQRACTRSPAFHGVIRCPVWQRKRELKVLKLKSTIEDM
jgi:hypothetical protein